MIREHPRGAGPLVGCQIRYLIRSEHGWLGGLGFSASALQLHDRDEWIGWDRQTRRRHLHRVTNLSRFLIRSCVRCPNLASRVLGMALRRIGDDFELGYGYRPWLVESFGQSHSIPAPAFRPPTADRGGPYSGAGTPGSRQCKARDGQSDLPVSARAGFSRSNGGRSRAA